MGSFNIYMPLINSLTCTWTAKIDTEVKVDQKFVNHNNSSITNLFAQSTDCVKYTNTTINLLPGGGDKWIIENLKNIVLNLQSYTMEVNKTLMEERVRVLSDIEQPARTLKIDNARVSFSTEKQIEYLEDIGEFSMSESGI
jgi:hypothetical protein